VRESGRGNGYLGPGLLMAGVEVTFSGPRADIRLSRPEVLNAMDMEVFDGLAAAADEIAKDPAVRVVVVTGEGRAFSAGIDVSSIGGIADSTEATVARAQAGFRKIAALEIPTVASVQGFAFGAGLQLALACDIRVIADDAKLGLLEANFGLIPDLIGSTRLPQIVGAGRAKKMIWLAEKIDGREAGKIGLAEVVVTPEQLQRSTDELAGRLAEAPVTPVRQAKKLIDASASLSVNDGMDAEAEAQLACMSAPDFADNLMAGLQKLSRS
jgi:enoyl-CoA hydratase/carnithine racemase